MIDANQFSCLCLGERCPIHEYCNPTHQRLKHHLYLIALLLDDHSTLSIADTAGLYPFLEFDSYGRFIIHHPQSSIGWVLLVPKHLLRYIKTMVGHRRVGSWDRDVTWRYAYSYLESTRNLSIVYSECFLASHWPLER